MPLDYSIPLSARAPTMRSPLESYSGMLQLRDAQQQYTLRRLQMEERQRDLADEDLIRTTFQQHLQPGQAPDFDRVTNAIDSLNPRAGMKFRKMVSDMRKDSLDTFIKERDALDKALDQGSRLMHGVLDAVKDPKNQREVEAAQTLYQQVAPQVRQMLPAYANQIPEQYDPAAVDRMVKWGKASQEHLNELKQAAEDARQLIEAPKSAAEANAKYKEITARTLSTTVGNPDAWAAAKQELAMFAGVPQQTLDWFGDYSPENVQRATGFLQSGRAEARRQQADNLEVLRNGKWVGVPGSYDPTTDQYFEAGSTTPIKPGEVRLRPRVSELGILSPAGQAAQQRFEQGQEQVTERRLQDNLEQVENWYSKAISSWEDKGGADLAYITDPKLRTPLENQRKSLDVELEHRKLRALNSYRRERGLQPVKTLPPEWKTTKPSGQSQLLPMSAPLQGRPLTGTGQLASAGLPDVQNQARMILQQAGRDSSPQSIALFLQNPTNRAALGLA